MTVIYDEPTLILSHKPLQTLNIDTVRYATTPRIHIPSLSNKTKKLTIATTINVAHLHTSSSTPSKHKQFYYLHYVSRSLLQEKYE